MSGGRPWKPELNESCIGKVIQCHHLNLMLVILSISLHGRYRISRPIRCTMIFSLGILEKNNDECIFILVIYWKKTGLLHSKISKHNIIYWKKTGLLHCKISKHNIIYWKKTGLLHSKINNHNIIYWKKTRLLHTKISNHNIIYWKKTGLLHTLATII